MKEIPIPDEVVKTLAKELDIQAPGSSSIREIANLVDKIEEKTGIKFIRMEMGVPGLPSPSIAIEAEIAALKKGVAVIYLYITGVESLKMEISRFIKLFLNIELDPRGCIPTVGSMMESMISFLVANRNDKNKEGTLFIDPGFPVQKQQVKMLGQNY